MTFLPSFETILIGLPGRNPSSVSQVAPKRNGKTLSIWTNVFQTISIGAEPLGWNGPPVPSIAPAFLDHVEKLGTLDWSDRASVVAFHLEIARLSAGKGHMFDADRESRRI